MKIMKIITQWDDGKKYSIKEPEVTEFLRASGNEIIYMYLLLALALNLQGGFHWSEEC